MIEKIKLLDIETQAAIVSHIQEVSKARYRPKSVFSTSLKSSSSVDQMYSLSFPGCSLTRVRNYGALCMHSSVL